MGDVAQQGYGLVFSTGKQSTQKRLKRAVPLEMRRRAMVRIRQSDRGQWAGRLFDKPSHMKDIVVVPQSDEDRIGHARIQGFHGIEPLAGR